MVRENSTNEFSFILKPSQHGIGVFAAHDIKVGTFLRLFGDGKLKNQHRVIKKKDVPKIFQEYPLDRGDTLWCPPDFGAMPIGWYLNHSGTPNAAHKNYDYYATRDIAGGEEILIDYNTLEEPEGTTEDYYKT